LKGRRGGAGIDLMFRGSVVVWGTTIMVSRSYFARQAATLIKFARSTSDPQVVAALVEKAVDLKSQVDESAAPDPSPLPPDVERPT
jgi:hypothetical protein